MKNTQNNIDDYKQLPWTRIFKKNKDGSFFAEIKELKGCITEGETIEDANQMLDDALEAWLEIAIEKNIPIPEPSEALNINKYSGKILIRVPKSLHRDLILKSALENVSLNAFVSSLLARGI